MIIRLKKWLCLFLACLLGAAPPGVVLAEYHTPQSASHHISVSAVDDGYATVHDLPTHHCPDCTPEHLCDDLDCSCDQCTTSLTLFFPTDRGSSVNLLSQRLPTVAHGLITHTPTPLYRPPRD